MEKILPHSLASLGLGVDCYVAFNLCYLRWFQHSPSFHLLRTQNGALDIVGHVADINNYFDQSLRPTNKNSKLKEGYGIKTSAEQGKGYSFNARGFIGKYLLVLVLIKVLSGFVIKFVCCCWCQGQAMLNINAFIIAKMAKYFLFFF